ncbi:hypothetical protein [Sphaerisporangium sp. TRM90804]|uniref:hypothetical protein n=1 Tax=Sphaerisporangium sp. TRM90804 TaxID=3031113 RepID=UPI002449EF29|nr:hypothetical protein [Sphaerisporangium sp. TRM90804]MDH2428133.1 hypothetical protein [Sphaerisporangium sp. TRM90804]
MQLLFAFGYVIALLVATDRLMLWLEARGHLNWRRTGRKVIPAGPGVGLDVLGEGPGPT